MTKQEALFKYSLRLGDNALILGHRLSEWSSYAPTLEEDLALTNIALDQLGRAQAFLHYSASIEGAGRSADDLVFRRGERQFFNNLLHEQPNGDFAVTLVRQLFISVFEQLYFSSLQSSKDETFAGIAAKSVKEIKYHVRHASDWVIRLGDGTDESHQRAQTAVDDLWMYTGELFEMDESDVLLIEEGIVPDLTSLHSEWNSKVGSILSEATLVIPRDGFMQTGSRRGIHSEGLGFILAEMQYLQRAYPDAKW